MNTVPLNHAPLWHMYNWPMPPTDEQIPAAAGERPGAAAKKPAGPWVGIVIIVVMLIFGALYYWQQVAAHRPALEPLPLIPGEPAAG